MMNDSTADRGPTTGAPRWVKVLGIVAVVVVALLIIVMLASGGDHGPGRHTLPAGPAGHTKFAAETTPQP